MRVLGIFLLLVSLTGASAWGAGPFHYRLPQASGVDSEAVTVVGQPQTHHIVRYENLYSIAEKYDLGIYDLANYHRDLDHFYLPWETDITIPTQWIIPEMKSFPGYLINLAELRGYRFFPEKNEVFTYPVGVGVLDYKSPIGRHFRVQSKAVNPGWHIPAHLQAKYGMSYMPPGPDCPVGNRWMGLGHYGLHGTAYPMGVGRLVSHGCIRHYPEDIIKLFDMTPVGTSVEFIYQPVKIGYLKGRIFMSVHQDIYAKIPDMLQFAIKKVQDHNLASRINWVKFLQTVAEQTGAPVDISPRRASLAQNQPGSP
jgi:L,D-transpeptidase ErfK/SrfK